MRQHKPGCPGYQINCDCFDAPEGVSGPEQPINDAETKLHLLVAHLEALDSQLTRLGEGEFVEGYQMKTGAWHRILGIIRGDPMLALRRDLEMQIPFARAAEEAYRKAGEVSQAALQSEVRVSGPEQGAAGPTEALRDVLVLIDEAYKAGCNHFQTADAAKRLLAADRVLRAALRSAPPGSQT